MARWTNWARNQSCAPTDVARPTTEEALAARVAAAHARGLRVRAVGSGHSFSGLVPTAGVVADVGALDGLLALDHATGYATFGAGTSLAAASVALARHGRALENLGDVAVQTLAGATQTGTHGTGIAYGNLASTIVAVRMVTGIGEVVDLDVERDPDALRAVRVGLGALGILTQVTVRTVPAFTLDADERVEPVDDVLADLDSFVDGHDHAEFFWFPGSELAYVKRNDRVDEGDASGRPRTRAERVLVEELVSNLALGGLVRASDRVPVATRGIHTMLRALPPSRYREPSHQVFASPRRFRFVEMELSVPREAFPEAFARLRRTIAADGRAVPLPVECRFVAGDDADLSPAHGGDRAYLAVHLSPRSADDSWFRAIAAAVDDLGVRPHWGKLHDLDATSLAPRYPRWDAFQEARRHFDPDGTFANAHIDRVLGPIGPRAVAA